LIQDRTTINQIKPLTATVDMEKRSDDKEKKDLLSSSESLSPRPPVKTGPTLPAVGQDEDAMVG
jgi:hypothetical protein